MSLTKVISCLLSLRMSIKDKIREILGSKVVMVYGLAQILNLLSLYFIGKSYTSDQYGLYILISTFAGIFITLSNGKYNNNIVSSNIVSERRILIWLSVIINLVLNSIGFIFIYLLAPNIVQINFLNTNFLMVPVAFWISLYCFVAGLNLLSDSVLNSVEYYQKMSFGRLVKSVFFLISVSVFKDLGWKGLILSVLIGQICQLMLNVDVLIKKASKKVPTYIEITSIARKYFASPKYNIPLSLLIATSDYIFYALIRQFWGLYFLGNFSMAEKIVRIPVSLIGQPLSEKFFKTSSNQNSSGEIDKLRVRFLSYLKDGFLLLLIPSIICAVFGEKIVKILLPEQWHNVGWIIRIMSPLIFTYFLIASMRILPIVLNIQRRYTFLESLTFLLLCFLITAAGVLGFPDYLLVILKMAGEVLISLYITYWLYNKIGIQSNSNA